MQCKWCEGELQRAQRTLPPDVRETLAAKVTGTPPRHRKKRIRKKWLKRWQGCRLETEDLMSILDSLANTASRNMQCTKCGAREGFYGAVARSMFPVQKMPVGALAIYDKEPEEIPVRGRRARDEDLRIVQALRETGLLEDETMFKVAVEQGLLPEVLSQVHHPTPQSPGWMRQFDGLTQSIVDEYVKRQKKDEPHEP